MRSIPHARWRAPLALFTPIAVILGSLPTSNARAQLASELRSRANEEHFVRVGDDLQPFSLPTGGDKTGISSQAISVPQGSGKVDGMGESFSTQMSTGVATFTVPFGLAPARGAVEPTLTLSYSSGGGHGVAGVGWEVGWPYIARQTDRGLPTYDDRAAWHPQQDRFVFNGGQELVPICRVAGAACADAAAPLPAGEALPAWADGWQYFRARIEGSYLRFFWSPDHRTWRVQSKSGESMEIGVPQDGSGYAGALEADPSNAAHIFRWNISRQYDNAGSPPPAGAASPAPVNVVAYRYASVGGLAYLTDIFDTPPAANASTAPLGSYAHHTRLLYETRPDATSNYRRGWRVDQTMRMTGVDVTSRAYLAPSGPRHAVRRYHLAYDPAYHVSLLASVTLEGRCSGNEAAAPAEDPSTQTLPPKTGCASLPPMTFGYQHVTPYRVDGSPGVADLAGYEGFDERVIPMTSSPPSSIDESLADLFDINSDGLPDLVVTTPGADGKFPMYLTGETGIADSFSPTELGVHGVLGATASSLRLTSPNVSVSDIDGDGTIDWLHQPAVKTYAVYTPQFLNGGWWMMGRAVAAAGNQDPHLDLGSDTPDIQVLDANGDGLVDVVRATGTELQTFFSLGRYPGGDGNFGSAKWTGPASAGFSLSPVTSCVPLVAAGVPVRFSDSTIRLADMNADGLADIVYTAPGDVRYWPGRGDGSWGTGPLGACASGFDPSSYVAMAQSPEYSDPNGSGIRIDDVNGDGLDDVVQVRSDAIDIWLNVDGIGFTTQRHVIQGVTPAQGPLWQSKVRLVDVNGSGTRDVLWGEAGQYRYVDLQGGQQPWVLTHVANGLGKTTDIAYGTSTEMMLAATKAGSLWQSKAPMPLHVVTSETERDNLDVVGRPAGAYVTQYSYRDPVYDGRQREFRGFRSATATRWGDANSPTSTTSSQFLLGECADDEPPPAGLSSVCVPAGRWADNPREALKGLPAVTESYDQNNVYLSTVHHAYTLRRLYTGLDGRVVRVAFESQTDTWKYDTAAFVPASGGASAVVDVVFDSPTATVPSVTLVGAKPRAIAGTAHLRATSSVDRFGNSTDGLDLGCVDGLACPTADPKIETVAIPELIPEGSGWCWRNAESYVDDAAGGAERKHTYVTYDSNCRPIKTEADLVGSLPLDRFHETGAATAGNVAPSASVDGRITESQTSYDSFGNVAAQAAPNARCRVVEYVTDYADVPAVEHVYAGIGASGTCGALGTPRGGTDLSTRATYDRGSGAVTDVFDLHGEHTTAAYDDFGRIVQVSRPSPTALGQTSPVPSVLIDYSLATASRPYSIVHTRTQTGATDADAQYQESVGYSDGLGRAIVTFQQADPSIDLHQWVVNGLTAYDSKGAVQRAYLAWFWDGDPLAQAGGVGAYPLSQAPATPYSRQRYDAFGRQVQSVGLDGAVTLQSVYHALSIDKWDAADLTPGPHAGTPVTAQADGHGRVVAAIERAHVGSSIEARTTRTDFLPTGEPYRITRTRGQGDDVVRWLRYDSLGRMVLNVEPNTTKGFTADPTAAASAMKAWRYAFDDDGDLVGISDARGCGANYAYDSAGRIVVEDYSPCRASQAPYSQANTSTGVGAEVYYEYDAVPAWLSGQSLACEVDPHLQLGRLVAVSDRASRSVTAVDGRGRTTCVARQVAQPGVPSDTPSERYTPTWFSQSVAMDGADRPVDATTGAKALVDPATGTSAVHTEYTLRGTVKRVASSYGTKDATGWADLVSSATHDADGLVGQITYGDLAHTKTSMAYDVRRRLSSVQTYRGPPAAWTQQPAPYSPAPSYGGAPTTLQLLLEDVDYAYDVVDNPTEIHDWRMANEWPAGAQPVTQKVRYDDLNRVARVDYQYPGGTDAWVDPFAAEDGGAAKDQDPRRAKPSPHVAFPARPLWQTFAYDWLGNTTATSDDAKGFYDRSLGAVTNGASSAQPYQLKSATGGVAPRDGSVNALYDDAGNLAGLTLVRDASAACLPSGASCSQRFAYDWDEVGRLARARRWDGAALGAVSDPLPAATPAVALEYAYDGSDNRVLKTATDGQGNQAHTVYALPSVELRRATFDGTSYEDDAQSEVVYLAAHGVRLGRIHYATTDVPTSTSGQLHVLLELPDHLGSTSVVLDRETSELVERTTYQAYGGVESDYRPERWEGFREDYRFTGKEEDEEAGVVFFGARYLSPLCGRWLSADPAAIHGLGADLNVYAYVHGRVLSATDPLGLQEREEGESLPGGPGMERSVPTGTKTKAVETKVEVETHDALAPPPKPVGFLESAGAVAGNTALGIVRHVHAEFSEPADDSAYADEDHLVDPNDSISLVSQRATNYLLFAKKTNEAELKKYDDAMSPMPDANDTAGRAGAGIMVFAARALAVLGLMSKAPPVIFADATKTEAVSAAAATAIGPESRLSSAGEAIPWSSGKLSRASRLLDQGETSVAVASRAEAEELFLGKFQGEGYRNTTGLGNQLYDKSMTYHWDETFGPDGLLEGHAPTNPHATIPHLQLHTPKEIIRIFFKGR